MSVKRSKARRSPAEDEFSVFLANVVDAVEHSDDRNRHFD
jgi:hypothetical protein